MNEFKTLALLGIVIGSLAVVGTNAVRATVLAEKLVSTKKQQTEEQRPAALTVTILTSESCMHCSSPTQLLNALQQKNVTIDSQKTVYVETDEGRDLASRYSVASIPALVVEGEIDKFDDVRSLLAGVGTVTAIDSSSSKSRFVQTTVAPPYFSVDQRVLRGEYAVTFLRDATCTDCFDVSAFESAFRGIGMTTDQQELIDVNDDAGKRLVDQYGITAVPTALLTGDLGVYPSLDAVWQQVGTVEEDGVYVLRTLDNFGSYKNLETGEVVSPAAAGE